VYDHQKKEFVLNTEKPYTTLQLVRDFTATGGGDKPARLASTKPKGQSSITNIDAALRLNFYRPSWADLSKISFAPTLDLDYSKSGLGDSKEEQIDYYLLGDFGFLDSWGITKANRLKIGPVYKEDKVNRIETLTGLIEWTPVLKLGNYVTGSEYSVNNNISFFLQPEISYEFNDIRKKPVDTELVDENFIRFGLSAKVSFGKRVSLGYEYKIRKEQNGKGRTFDIREWDLSWKLDPNDLYSLSLEYEKGARPPLFEEVNNYTLGLGVSF